MSVFSHIRCAARSDVGRKRKNNEDAFGLFPAIGVYCVADGMGGGDDGEVASAATVRAVESFAKEHPFPPNVAYSAADVADGLRDSLNDASAWISARAQARHLKGCGSTFVGIVFDAACPNQAIALHAGDSRLYRLRDRTIQQMTKDHSAAELIGAKDESEVNPMFRGMILRAVGVEPTVEIESTRVPVQEGDRLLICSDGLSRLVPDDRMLSIVRGSGSLDLAVEALINEANAAGGVDNITVELLEVGALPKALPTVTLVRTVREVVGPNTGTPSGAADATTDADTQSTDDGGVLPLDTASGETDSSDSSGRGRATTGETLTLPEEEPEIETDSRRLIRRKTVWAALAILLVLVSLGVVFGILRRNGDSPRTVTECRPQPPPPQMPVETNGADRAESERKTEGVAASAEESPCPPAVEKPTEEKTACGEYDAKRRLEALAAFEEVCEPDVAATFVRKTLGILGKDMPESISIRFKPLTRSSPRSQKEKLAAAVELTRDVQVIVRKLMDCTSGYLRDVEAQLADPSTTEECRRALKETPGRVAEFQENARPFVAGDPTNPDVQFKCILMIHSVPRWF